MSERPLSEEMQYTPVGQVSFGYWQELVEKVAVLEADNARLRSALDVTTTLLSAILSTTELSEEHPEEAASYPDLLAPRNRDQFKHVLSQAIDVLGPPSDG